MFEEELKTRKEKLKVFDIISEKTNDLFKTKKGN